MNKYLLVDRSAVFDENGKKLSSNSSLVRALDSGEVNDIDTALVSQILKSHSTNGFTIISQRDNIKLSDPVFYDFLFKQNISALFLVELVFNGVNVGFLRLDMMDARHWTVENTEIIKLLGKFFSMFLYKLNGK